MNKKLIGGIALALAVTLGAGGYVATQAQQNKEEINEQIEALLDSLEDVTVTEGDSLPDLKSELSTSSLIASDTLEVDIQNVDVTVPGTYEIRYEFEDVNGQDRVKTVTCTVEVDLLEHVEGLKNLTIDQGDELPDVGDYVTYDSYVASVTRDDTQVLTDTPGSYAITYSILGTDGDLEETEYLATVLETKVTETILTSDDEEDEETDDTATGSDAEDNTTETGNVQMEVIDNVVETADASGVYSYMAILALSLGLISFTVGVLAGRRKSNKRNPE